MAFLTDAQTTDITVDVGLGYYAGSLTGIAFFDDITLKLLKRKSL